jgi:hypothetical protein
MLQEEETQTPEAAVHPPARVSEVCVEVSPIFHQTRQLRRLKWPPVRRLESVKCVQKLQDHASR